MDLYLRQLKMPKTSHKKDRTYQLWQEGSHPKQIFSKKMFRQKARYIHENPVKRGYVAESIPHKTRMLLRLHRRHFDASLKG